MQAEQEFDDNVALEEASAPQSFQPVDVILVRIYEVHDFLRRSFYIHAYFAFLNRRSMAASLLLMLLS